MSDTWYAVQTRPGAQLAFRRYRREKRFGKNGQEIKPVLTIDRQTKITAIERAFDEAGITHYMPAELKTVIHHRTKKPINRRFPMLPGYVFVANVTDWPALTRIAGVESVLGICGTPVAIPQTVIDGLRMAEHQINQANAESERLRKEATKPVTRKRLAKTVPVGKRVTFNHQLLGRVSGTVTDVTGRKAVKVALDQLANLKPVEVSIDQLLKVA